jgi:hypothetical protein
LGKCDSFFFCLERLENKEDEEKMCRRRRFFVAAFGGTSSFYPSPKPPPPPWKRLLEAADRGGGLKKAEKTNKTAFVGEWSWPSVNHDQDSSKNSDNTFASCSTFSAPIGIASTNIRQTTLLLKQAEKTICTNKQQFLPPQWHGTRSLWPNGGGDGDDHDVGRLSAAVVKGVWLFGWLDGLSQTATKL